MEEQSRAQELSVREISLIRELAQIRKEHKRELEYEKFDGYELPPRTQFSMLNKPAVSIKYGVMKFNMACIRLFEGIKYVLPILHPNKKRLALIMCPEEDSASVEWARQKGENWVNKDITSLEFVENIFRLMNWNRECRYKVLGRVANSDQGLCMLFDLEEAREGMKLRKTQLSYRLKKMNGNVRKDGKIWNTGVALLKYFAGLNSNQNGQYGQIYAEKFTSACLICKVFYGKMKTQ